MSDDSLQRVQRGRDVRDEEEKGRHWCTIYVGVGPMRIITDAVRALRCCSVI